eukprot:GHVN01096697.1.p1 GENE.GHVN01096697.1~~GHVN01096697.1.p1  ORF type:complete len:1033 (-),score=161.72 GHVN01096697.1:338-3436(-)
MQRHDDVRRGNARHGRSDGGNPDLSPTTSKQVDMVLSVLAPYDFGRAQALDLVARCQNDEEVLNIEVLKIFEDRSSRETEWTTTIDYRAKKQQIYQDHQQQRGRGRGTGGARGARSGRGGGVPRGRGGLGRPQQTERGNFRGGRGGGRGWSDASNSSQPYYDSLGRSEAPGGTPPDPEVPAYPRSAKEGTPEWGVPPQPQGVRGGESHTPAPPSRQPQQQAPKPQRPTGTGATPGASTWAQRLFNPLQPRTVQPSDLTTSTSDHNVDGVAVGAPHDSTDRGLQVSGADEINVQAQRVNRESDCHVSVSKVDDAQLNHENQFQHEEVHIPQQQVHSYDSTLDSVQGRQLPQVAAVSPVLQPVDQSKAPNIQPGAEETKEPSVHPPKSMTSPAETATSHQSTSPNVNAAQPATIVIGGSAFSLDAKPRGGIEILPMAGRAQRGPPVGADSVPVRRPIASGEQGVQADASAETHSAEAAVQAHGSEVDEQEEVEHNGTAMDKAQVGMVAEQEETSPHQQYEMVTEDRGIQGPPADAVNSQSGHRSRSASGQGSVNQPVRNVARIDEGSDTHLDQLAAAPVPMDDPSQQRHAYAEGYRHGHQAQQQGEVVDEGISDERDEGGEGNQSGRIAVHTQTPNHSTGQPQQSYSAYPGGPPPPGLTAQPPGGGPMVAGGAAPTQAFVFPTSIPYMHNAYYAHPHPLVQHGYNMISPAPYPTKAPNSAMGHMQPYDWSYHPHQSVDDGYGMSIPLGMAPNEAHISQGYSTGGTSQRYQNDSRESERGGAGQGVNQQPHGVSQSQAIGGPQQPGDPVMQYNYGAQPHQANGRHNRGAGSRTSGGNGVGQVVVYPGPQQVQQVAGAPVQTGYGAGPPGFLAQQERGATAAATGGVAASQDASSPSEHQLPSRASHQQSQKAMSQNPQHQQLPGEQGQAANQTYPKPGWEQQPAPALQASGSRGQPGGQGGQNQNSYSQHPRRGQYQQGSSFSSQGYGSRYDSNRTLPDYSQYYPTNGQTGYQNSNNPPGLGQYGGSYMPYAYAG